MLEINKIYNEDCLEGMKKIEDKSIDMILCDLPYGTTKCRWDNIIPLDKLWEEYKRIIKDEGTIVLTGSQIFTTLVIEKNKEMFRYEWIWVKNNCTGFLQAKYRPLKNHENIMVFSKKQGKYNPQGVVKVQRYHKAKQHRGGRIIQGDAYEKQVLQKDYVQEYSNYPKSVIHFDREVNTIHPTQKPLALFEYLIKTYTDEGDIVLDNCIGSGTTAVACIRTNRNYIGFELDNEYYSKALERIKNEREAN